MERYTVFVDWKNQYFQNDYTIQGNQIQCNPYQVTNGIFQRTRTKHLIICMETNKKPQIKAVLRVKIQVPWLQSILQSYSHQNSTVLAQNQTYRSMEQDSKPRNTPMQLWSSTLWQRWQEYAMDKRRSLQYMVLRKLESYM